MLGACVAEVCRHHDVSTAPIYTWRRKPREVHAETARIAWAVISRKKGPRGHNRVTVVRAAGEQWREDGVGVAE